MKKTLTVIAALALGVVLTPHGAGCRLRRAQQHVSSEMVLGNSRYLTGITIG